MQDIFAHHPKAKLNLKWYQFGKVSVLRIREPNTPDIAFICQYVPGYGYDLAMYPDTTPQELKDLLDKGESLPEGLYSQPGSSYGVAYEVLSKLKKED